MMTSSLQTEHRYKTRWTRGRSSNSFSLCQGVLSQNSSYAVHFCPSLAIRAVELVNCVCNMGSLPKWEIGAYFVIWIGVSIYGILRVLITSLNVTQRVMDGLDLGTWPLGKYKDNGDTEWTLWIHIFGPQVLLGLIGHFVVARICELPFLGLVQHRFHACAVYTAAFLYYVIGLQFVAVLLFHAVIMYVIARSRVTWLCWLYGLMVFEGLTFEPFRTLQLGDHRNQPYYMPHVTSVTMVTSIMRLISLGLDLCDKDKQNEGEKKKREKDGQREESSIFESLTYIFYMPTFFLGPLMTFEDFKQQTRQNPHACGVADLWGFLVSCARYACWGLLLEFIYHHFFIHMLQRTFFLFQSLDMWTLGAIGFLQCQCFQLKYTVLYGVAGTFARADGIVTPGTPKVIAVIYAFGDMWKNFDKGLHKWMLRHVYIPLGGSRRGLPRQVLSSFAPFLVLAVRGGGDLSIIVWAGANWLGVVLETLARTAARTPYLHGLKTKYAPSAASERRLVALFHGCLLAPAFISMLVFLGGINVGRIYALKTYVIGFPLATLVTTFFMFCRVQGIMELEGWENVDTEKNVEPQTHKKE
ncbi:protein-cysteine N-palmitoyltransferase HHAT-like [Branchiostoma floridae x Branchiostoma japonicum]